jgi:hypothetical protein
MVPGSEARHPVGSQESVDLGLFPRENLLDLPRESILPATDAHGNVERERQPGRRVRLGYGRHPQARCLARCVISTEWTPREGDVDLTRSKRAHQVPGRALGPIVAVHGVPAQVRDEPARRHREDRWRIGTVVAYERYADAHSMELRGVQRRDGGRLRSEHEDVRRAIVRPRDLHRFKAPRASERDDLSFYSGHTTEAVSLAVAAGTVASLRGYRLAPLVWGTSLPVALVTGYLRIAADRHYFTDVLVGAVAGAAVGFLVPYLFHRPDGAEANAGPPGPTPLVSFSGTW